MQDELLDFVSKGADLVITKPMKPNLLDSLISLVNTEGSQSQDGKQLSFHDDHIHWEAKMSSSSLKQQEMSSSLKSPKNK
jgi:DNA-binding response OmpR family regulator